LPGLRVSVWLFFFLVILGRHSHRLCSVFIFVRYLRDSLLPPSGSFTGSRASCRFIPRLQVPWVLVFPFPADPFCCSGCSSCCGLISGFRASEARPGVEFLTCRPSCCFLFSPISVSACLHLLSRDLFSPFCFLLLLSHRAARTTIPCRFFASHRAAVLVS
jgi:hypothetical protein